MSTNHGLIIHNRQGGAVVMVFSIAILLLAVMIVGFIKLSNSILETSRLKAENEFANSSGLIEVSNLVTQLAKSKPGAAKSNASSAAFLNDTERELVLGDSGKNLQLKGIGDYFIKPFVASSRSQKSTIYAYKNTGIDCSQPQKKLLVVKLTTSQVTPEIFGSQNLQAISIKALNICGK